MRNQIDWCKFFANIEANPKAYPPRLTVRQQLQAREHLYGCDVCFNRSERVLAKPRQNKFSIEDMN